MDTLTRKQRSERMALIRSKNTKPELAVRSLLHAAGYRFRVHDRTLPGRPDIVFRRRRKVIFVHGCFWHGHVGCKIANIPKSQTKYWVEKFTNNQLRDSKNLERLSSDRWKALILWECEAKNLAKTRSALIKFLGSPKFAAKRRRHRD